MSECCDCKKKREVWMTGTVETPVGKIPQVETRLTLRDKIGAVKVRFSIGRMNYAIPPGLYAIGNPTPESPVFVTANYKLTFDCLRGALSGIDTWVLILDTKGINVWCAAAEGTFGTAEIANRVQKARLDEVVTHRKLILPQLGAAGISAPDVAKQCGFQIIYGTVRAEDLPAFIAANFKTTPAMRKVQFTLRDRVILVPEELIIWFKPALSLAIWTALLSGFSRSGYSFDNAPREMGLIFTGWLTGGALVPICLPWLPGRAFAVKGVSAAVILWLVFYKLGLLGSSRLEIAGWGLLINAMISYIALNFTGTSPYTSMSGGKKERKIAIPLQLTAAVLGLVLILLGGLL